MIFYEDPCDCALTVDRQISEEALAYLQRGRATHLRVAPLPVAPPPFQKGENQRVTIETLGQQRVGGNLTRWRQGPLSAITR